MHVFAFISQFSFKSAKHINHITNLFSLFFQGDELFCVTGNACSAHSLPLQWCLIVYEHLWPMTFVIMVTSRRFYAAETLSASTIAFPPIPLLPISPLQCRHARGCTGTTSPVTSGCASSQTVWDIWFYSLWKQSLLSTTFLTSHIGELFFAPLLPHRTPLVSPHQGSTMSRSERSPHCWCYTLCVWSTIRLPHNELPLNNPQQCTLTFLRYMIG